MKKHDSENDLFDDDFEIIYEYLDDSDTDSDIDSDMEPPKEKAKPAGNTIPPKSSQTRPQKPPQKRQKKAVPDQKSVPSSKKYTTVKSSAPADEKQQKKRKKRRKAPNLLSPAMSTAKAGGKAVYKIAGMLLRYGSVFLIGYILYLTASRLWNGRTAYGDLYLLIKQKNYILGAYSVTTCVLLLYELISLFWAFSGPKTREGRKVEKIDTGRGFLFFILILAGSFLSASFSSMIPQSPALLQGISGALNIYGGLKSVLLPVCGIGAVLCLIRKFVTK